MGAWLPLRHRTEWQYTICIGFQSIEIVSPGLHHFSAFRQECSAVIGSPVGIFDCGCQLVFYQVGPDAEHFIENCPRCGTETVPGRNILWDAHGWVRT